MFAKRDNCVKMNATLTQNESVLKLHTSLSLIESHVFYLKLRFSEILEYFCNKKNKLRWSRMSLINKCGVSFVSAFVWKSFLCEICTVLGSKLLAKNRDTVHLFQMCLELFFFERKIYFVGHRFKQHWKSYRFGTQE